MEGLPARIWENLGGRIDGPLSFRLLLQPAVATVLAIRAGIEDARTGRPPYLRTILSNPADRGRLLREGWKAVAGICLFAVIIDSVYQLIVYHWVYLFDLLFVAFLLACVPYLLVRGLANRFARARRS